MSVPIAHAAPVLVDAEGRVCVDAVCLGCGYNLRSLPEDAVCPECAQPVRRSLAGEQLRFAQAQWVRLLARGATCLVIALAIMRHLMSLTRSMLRPGLVTFLKIEFWGMLVCGTLFLTSYALTFAMGFGFVRKMSAAATMPAATAISTIGYTGGGTPT